MKTEPSKLRTCQAEEAAKAAWKAATSPPQPPWKADRQGLGRAQDQGSKPRPFQVGKMEAPGSAAQEPQARRGRQVSWKPGA